MNSTKTKMQLNKIHDAIEDIKNGKGCNCCR